MTRKEAWFRCFFPYLSWWSPRNWTLSTYNAVLSSLAPTSFFFIICLFHIYFSEVSKEKCYSLVCLLFAQTNHTLSRHAKEKASEGSANWAPSTRGWFPRKLDRSGNEPELLLEQRKSSLVLSRYYPRVQWSNKSTRKERAVNSLKILIIVSSQTFGYAIWIRLNVGVVLVTITFCSRWRRFCEIKRPPGQRSFIKNSY